MLTIDELVPLEQWIYLCKPSQVTARIDEDTLAQLLEQTERRNDQQEEN